MKTVAIITAAGYGKRMGQPKQFLEIGGKAMLEITASVFEKAKIIDEIIGQLKDISSCFLDPRGRVSDMVITDFVLDLIL